MGTKQLNIEIDNSLLNQAKSKAYGEGMKLYEWVSLAISEKLFKSAGENDQASELRERMREAQA